MQFSGGDSEERAQTAVAVDPQRLVILAAIGVAARAGIALLTIDVRLHGASVARFDVADSLADRNDFDAEFVSRNARIAEERHLAEIAGKISPADADPKYLD